mmetsp:Transcript_7270/g.11044  ORF Transcript_7270/g.11044 Transcript_7270/m.11044 type:complete len:548 (-) Transcript_7270:160-1803(-)
MKNVIALFATILILIIASADLVVSEGLQSRIIGGFEVNNHEYPYYAYVKIFSNPGGQLAQTLCGGTLIAKNVVLTAAHCINFDVYKIEVYLNMIKRNSRDKVESVNAIGWESHSDYRFEKNNVRNDIGLIYLGDTDRSVEPIKIKFDGRPDPTDVVATMGFGLQSDGDISDTLHVTFLDILSNRVCRTIFGEVLNTDLQFCTGLRHHAQAACKGDSGGPAIIRGVSYLEDVQVGIVAFGASDCNEGLTGYTRISGYESWLKQRVCSRDSTRDWCDVMAPPSDPLSDLLGSFGGESDDDETGMVGLASGCFSGSSTVQVKGIGQVKMKNLNIGDIIHVGNNVYEPISDHLVFIHDKGPITASQIKVGDQVFDGESNLNTVISVQKVTDFGLFNPFTPSGKIVVNNILSSNYIAFDDKGAWHIGSLTLNYHWLAHAAVAPLRIACYHVGSCKDETYSESGILDSLTLPLSHVRWVFAQTGLLHVIFMSIVGFICILQNVAENYIFHPVTLLILLSILCSTMVLLQWNYFLSEMGLSNFVIRGRTKIKLY